jgi:hypothetical protein
MGIIASPLGVKTSPPINSNSVVNFSKAKRKAIKKEVPQ